MEANNECKFCNICPHYSISIKEWMCKIREIEDHPCGLYQKYLVDLDRKTQGLSPLASFKF